MRHSLTKWARILLVGVVLLTTRCVASPSPAMPALVPSPSPGGGNMPILRPLAGYRIGIQAGHGQGDPGASSCDGTVHEADINAAVARKVVNRLAEYGARVDLFIGEDPGLSGYRADAFVALHTDYCPNPADPSSPSGYKVTRYGGAAGTGLKGNNDPSDRLAQALWDVYGQVTGLPQDRLPGHFTSDLLYYYALGQIHPSTPGAIIEMGWLSGDFHTLVNKQDKLAEGIALGILRFLTSGVPSGEAQSATVFVIDVSGSMADPWQGGVKLESAKSAARAVINMIEQESQASESNHQVAIVTFSTNATLNLGLTTDYAAARSVVAGLTSQDRTNIGAGLQVANEALASAPAGAQKIIILLSDGKTNEGLPPEEILAGPVAQAASAGTCIYTVGFGDPGDLDEGLLREIAEKSGCGTYSYASAPEELERVYIRLRHQSLGTVLAEFEGQIAQGETVDIGQVEVPPNQGELYITLHWPGSDLDLIVTDPRGREVRPGDPRVSLKEYERLIYLIIHDPAAGLWSLRAFGADIPERVLRYYAIVSVRERLGPPPTNTGAVLFGIGFFLVFGMLAVLIAVYSQRPQRPSAALQVLSGSAGQAWVPIRRPLTIGRDPRCGMVLSDPRVSARHAVIQPTRHGYILTDLGSRNGTFVNGQRVQQALLRGGERLRLGNTEMLFTTGTAIPQGPVSYPPTRAAAYLAVMAGEQEFARYPVASGTVLGRYPGCPVDLSADALVSQQHARLDYRAGQWVITDLMSRNGTYVNGQRIQAQTLQDGDEIQVGNTRMRFFRG